MKEKDLLKITDKMDKLGKKKYILKYGGFWGLFMFVFMTLFNTFSDVVIDHKNFTTYITSHHFILMIIIGLIIYPISGYFFGLWQWKNYHYKKDKMLRNR